MRQAGLHIDEVFLAYAILDNFVSLELPERHEVILYPAHETAVLVLWHLAEKAFSLTVEATIRFVLFICLR